jgi:hypothetical protein
MPNLQELSPGISKFSERVRYKGIAKQARYYVELTPPNVVSSNYGSDTVDMINLFVEQTMFPEFVVATQSNRANSNSVEMPYDRIFGPITMTFLCDRRMTVKHFFDMWTQGIYNTFGGVINYYDDYVVPEINIYKVDEQSSRVYCVTLYNAYPKVVNDMVLSSNSTDLSRFQVVFAYEMWKSFVIEGEGYDYANSLFMSDFGGTEGSFGNMIGSLAEIPGVDLILGGVNKDNANTMMNNLGLGMGMDILNKIKNPALLKDSLRRNARSVGSQLLKSTKSNVLNYLPSSVRQIGGSVLGRVGGALGL